MTTTASTHRAKDGVHRDVLRSVQHLSHVEGQRVTGTHTIARHHRVHLLGTN